jgi:hypothetical protein
MRNLQGYNEYIQSLEIDVKGCLFYHRIQDQIYITDATHKLLGIWDLKTGAGITPPLN